MSQQQHGNVQQSNVNLPTTVCLFHEWSTLRSLQNTWPHSNTFHVSNPQQPCACPRSCQHSDHSSSNHHGPGTWPMHMAHLMRCTLQGEQTYLANLQHGHKLTDVHSSHKNKHSKQNYAHQKIKQVAPTWSKLHQTRTTLTKSYTLNRTILRAAFEAQLTQQVHQGWEIKDNKHT